jgi:DNA-binding CsgD family transcriptional regulator
MTYVPKASSVDVYVSEVAGLNTQFDIFRFMKKVTEAYRTRAFMVFNLPSATARDLQSNTVITNWPVELLSAYDHEGLVTNSPVMRRLRTSTLPFFNDLSKAKLDRSDGKAGIVAAMFERFRMTCCAYFPTHDSSGCRGAISFSGDREGFGAEEMRELNYIAIHVFDRLAEIRTLDNRVVDALTDREIDCLNWTAAGKTSVEIAEILALSEHTINHYLNRATKKLDTVNRTQAVAKALRIGLIK